jgi:hypothetical protein
VELEDAIHIAILTLKEGFEGKMTEDNVEVSVLGKDGGFKVGGMTCLCVPRLLPLVFFVRISRIIRSCRTLQVLSKAHDLSSRSSNGDELRCAADHDISSPKCSSENHQLSQQQTNSRQPRHRTSQPAPTKGSFPLLISGWHQRRIEKDTVVYR